MMLNALPSHRSTMNELNIPTTTNEQEIASAISDISFRGSIANAVSRKVPSSATIRGSNPTAFRSGGSRVNVVPATKATNSALETNAAMINTK
jgi:hypothetical protein